MSRILSALLLGAAGLFAGTAHADPPRPPAAPSGVVPAANVTLTYRAFLAKVAHGNLDLEAQRYSVPIAEAQIAVAKVFPDPAITAGIASIDVSRKGAPTSTTVGLTWTVELGGKRSARIAAASAAVAEVRADLDDALRGLRASATGGFVDGLYTRLVLERKQQTLRSLEKLVSVNEERLRAGDVGKVALTQSRVEAQRFRGEALIAVADVEAADLALAVFLGNEAGPGSRVAPSGDLRLKPRTFTEGALVAQAKASRPDLVSKRRAAVSAAARADLARANRWVDVTLGVSWQHSFATRVDPFTSLAFDALSATVTVPVPLSRAYRGELDAALATEAQGRAAVAAAELKIEAEVRQAFVRYRAAVQKVALYTGGVLSDAEQVLDATLYNYQRGGATQLEVLEAQRTVNEVYLAYYDALAEHARALVALEQAAGIWDIDF